MLSGVKRFFRNLFLTLSSTPEQCIISSDYDCMLDPLNGHSSGTDSSHLQSKNVLLQSINDLNLIEICRKLHPYKNEVLCYVSIYKTFSHIDYFLISMSLLPHESMLLCQYSTVSSCFSSLKNHNISRFLLII